MIILTVMGNHEIELISTSVPKRLNVFELFMAIMPKEKVPRMPSTTIIIPVIFIKLLFLRFGYAKYRNIFLFTNNSYPIDSKISVLGIHKIV